LVVKLIGPAKMERIRSARSWRVNSPGSNYTNESIPTYSVSCTY